LDILDPPFLELSPNVGRQSPVPPTSRLFAANPLFSMPHHLSPRAERPGHPLCQHLSNYSPVKHLNDDPQMPLLFLPKKHQPKPPPPPTQAEGNFHSSVPILTLVGYINPFGQVIRSWVLFRFYSYHPPSSGPLLLITPPLIVPDPTMSRCLSREKVHLPRFFLPLVSFFFFWMKPPCKKNPP